MVAQSRLSERGATNEEGAEVRWWLRLAEKDNLTLKKLDLSKMLISRVQAVGDAKRRWRPMDM